MEIDNKDLSEIRSIINGLKMSDSEVENLKSEVEKRGLEGQINDFIKKYGAQINDVLQKTGANGGMSKEDKAKLVMEFQNKMTPSQQKQFKSVLSALKNYKNNKSWSCSV